MLAMNGVILDGIIYKEYLQLISKNRGIRLMYSYAYFPDSDGGVRYISYGDYRQQHPIRLFTKRSRLKHPRHYIMSCEGIAYQHTLYEVAFYLPIFPKDIELKPVTDIIETSVSEHTHIEVEAIHQDTREREISYARFLTWYALRYYTDATYPSIARMYGKDHTSIIHGINAVIDAISVYKHREKQLNDILADIYTRLHVLAFFAKPLPKQMKI